MKEAGEIRFWHQKRLYSSRHLAERIHLEKVPQVHSLFAFRLFILLLSENVLTMKEKEESKKKIIYLLDG